MKGRKTGVTERGAHAAGQPLRLEAAIFDVDGTLVDSAGDILRLLAESLAAEGLAAPAGELTPRLLGPPLEEIVAAIAPEAPQEIRARVVRRYRATYRDCGFAESPLFPHAAEQLEALRVAGVRLFVATYKPRDVSRRLLHHHGILGLFEATAHVDSGSSGRRLAKADMLRLLARGGGLAPGATLMQGDGPGDMAAALGCGMHAAAALYGYGDAADLLAEEPGIVLPSMDWGEGYFRASGASFRWESAKPWRNSV